MSTSFNKSPKRGEDGMGKAGWRHRRPAQTKRVTRASPVPCLPRKRKVDVTKCHTCHQMALDVSKCHACHAKDRGVTGDQRGPSASQEPAQCRKCHACHTNARSMSPSATPATPNGSGYLQVVCVCASCVWTRVVCGQVVCVCEYVVCV